MDARVTLDDVADGATRIELAADGSVVQPVHLVQLDDTTSAGLAAAARTLAVGRHGVLVAVATRPLPEQPALRGLLDEVDVVIGTALPGREAAGTQADAERLVERVEATPTAALLLTDVLRTGVLLDVDQALLLESLAYSTLLGGADFRRWRESADPAPVVPETGDPVRTTRTGDRLDLELHRPHRHNAFDHRLRDALVEALAVAEADPTIDEVVLTGAGSSFSSGGDLAEFGSASDPAAAHVLRTVQSPAAAVHRLRSRVRVELHGACIGAGIEVPSLAGRVDAAPGTWFQLPELAYGLIPGAGGTVGIARRIGRWRTAYLALLGSRLDLDTALEWGLVDGRL